MGYWHSNAHLKTGLPPVTDEPFVFCYYEKKQLLLLRHKKYMLLAVEVLHYEKASVKFSKTRRQWLRDLSKSALHLLELRKTPVTWSHFIISIFFLYLFFLRPYFEKHLDFCSLLYRLRDRSAYAAGAGTEGTIFSRRYIPFPRSRASYF